MKNFIKKLTTSASAIALVASSLMPGIVTPAHAASTNLVANPSAETPDSTGSLPANWQTGSWGTNNTIFQYLSTGHTGSRSLQVSISSYSSGDAKWYFDGVSVTPGSTYTFSDYYQSTTTTEVVAEVTLSNGSLQYLDLGPVQPSSAWNAESVNFTAPTNSSKITIFHLIQSTGSLTIDDVSLAAYTPTPPPVTNGVVNSSVETPSDTNPSSPAGWQSNSWGTNNAKFQYVTNAGHTGTHSVKITISSYTDGDAKWYFDPQPVQPSTTYMFSDWYQSNVTTSAVAQITAADGSISYLDIGTAPASSSWKQANFGFTTPGAATSVTVFHMLDKVGNLTTDDFSLLPVQLVTNGVPNASMELANNDQNGPLAWNSGGWGTNTASYQYLNTGHSGSHSVKVTISSYTDGDAKWYFDPQAVQPNTSYYFDDYYKSNIASHVVLQLTLTDGSIEYMGIGYLPASSSTWAHTHLPFTTPDNVANLTVLHLIDGKGYLNTDDYSITPYTITPLNQGMVTYTFDDALSSIYQNALPILNKYGVKSTQYIISGPVQDQTDPNYMTPDMVKAFFASGHEIGDHTVDHPDLTAQTKTQIDQEFSQSQNYLTNLVGTSPTDLATPYGTYNNTVIAESKKYFKSLRSVDTGYNDINSYDPYNIRVQNVDVTTAPATVQGWIDYANSHKVWLVLVFHGINNSPSEQYSWSPANLDTVLNYTVKSGIKTATMSQGVTLMNAATGH